MGKRGNNEGSIYKRKDGRWEAKLTTGYDARGKPVRRSTYHKTRKDAQDALRESQNRLAGNLAQLDSSTTVSEWAAVWIESKRSAIKPQEYLTVHLATLH